MGFGGGVAWVTESQIILTDGSSHTPVRCQPFLLLFTWPMKNECTSECYIPAAVSNERGDLA